MSPINEELRAQGSISPRRARRFAIPLSTSASVIAVRMLSAWRIRSEKSAR